jgi:hypothetical protein
MNTPSTVSAERNLFASRVSNAIRALSPKEKYLRFEFTRVLL